jgi:hypothetical protein
LKGVRKAVVKYVAGFGRHNLGRIGKTLKSGGIQDNVSVPLKITAIVARARRVFD